MHPLQSKFNLRSHKKQSQDPKQPEREREEERDRRRLADCILNPLNGLCQGVIGGSGSGSGSGRSTRIRLKEWEGHSSMLVSQLKNMNAQQD